jgi:DeoR/GlpR family transcriptional regulator of sugar metabolism
VTVDVRTGADAPADPILRRRHLLQRVATQLEAQGAEATVSDLAQVLGVSEATVRRDLQALRREGTPVTTRGRRTG